MEQIKSEKSGSIGLSPSFMKKTLIEGIVTLAIVGSLSGCKNRSESKINGTVDASVSETVTKHESQVYLEYQGNPEDVVKASVFVESRSSNELSMTPIQNAHLVFEYFEHGTDTYRSQWIAVPGCEDVVADISDTAYRPGPGGADVPHPFSYAKCDFSALTGNSFTARVTFVPQPGTDALPSSSEIEYRR